MVAACLEHAALAYAVPVSVAQHVLEAATRGGASGIGPMRIDRRWLPILAQAGFPIAVVEDDDCGNIAAGVWILAALGATTGHAPVLPIPLALGDATGIAGTNRGCVEQAAARNNISAALLDAVLRTENGHSGQTIRNRNGSYDIRSGHKEKKGRSYSSSARQGLRYPDPSPSRRVRGGRPGHGGPSSHTATPKA